MNSKLLSAICAAISTSLVTFAYVPQANADHCYKKKQTYTDNYNPSKQQTQSVIIFTPVQTQSQYTSTTYRQSNYQQYKSKQQHRHRSNSQCYDNNCNQYSNQNSNYQRY